ncbi:DUF1236 domain-containing protein [Rhizobium sp. C1]|uniref:DUF1236 domain-containing protein n=1 Tax=Rhizobium sp. C1 TaxID=1349799 RepID=UPI001E2E1F85|nr:DUF1236 domain-containing protein [Rhizobium sp. C1]MCD2177560.1 DUF1236 domain-containing protein [Rhizobium sp. C1]
MKKSLLIFCTIVAPLAATPVLANDSTVTGAAGGAVTGAIVGGPVGAAVGGVVGAIAGTALNPPPREVVTYVRERPVPTAKPVIIREEVRVGTKLPRQVVLTPVPDRPDYSYAIVNKERVIVDPQTYVVVGVVN